MSDKREKAVFLTVSSTTPKKKRKGYAKPEIDYQPPTAKEFEHICLRLKAMCREAGFRDDDIVFSRGNKNHG